MMLMSPGPANGPGSSYLECFWACSHGITWLNVENSKINLWKRGYLYYSFWSNWRSFFPITAAGFQQQFHRFICAEETFTYEAELLKSWDVFGEQKHLFSSRIHTARERCHQLFQSWINDANKAKSSQQPLGKLSLSPLWSLSTNLQCHA